MQKKSERKKKKVSYYESDFEEDIEAVTQNKDTARSKIPLTQDVPCVDRNSNNRDLPSEEREMDESTSGENSSSISSCISKNYSKGNIVETRDLIAYRRDNIAYFVASNGNPCGKGAKDLIEANKIPIKQSIQLNNLNVTKLTNNKQVTGLCIRNEKAESQAIIKENIYKTLTKLRDYLISQKITEISISKNSFIENILGQKF